MSEREIKIRMWMLQKQRRKIIREHVTKFMLIMITTLALAVGTPIDSVVPYLWVAMIGLFGCVILAFVAARAFNDVNLLDIQRQLDALDRDWVLCLFEKKKELRAEWFNPFAA